MSWFMSWFRAEKPDEEEWMAETRTDTAHMRSRLGYLPVRRPEKCQHLIESLRQQYPEISQVDGWTYRMPFKIRTQTFCLTFRVDQILPTFRLSMMGIHSDATAARCRGSRELDILNTGSDLGRLFMGIIEEIQENPNLLLEYFPNSTDVCNIFAASSADVDPASSSPGSPSSSRATWGSAIGSWATWDFSICSRATSGFPSSSPDSPSSSPSVSPTTLASKNSSRHYYANDSKSRGLVLIINNETFRSSSGSGSERSGTKFDAESLQKTLCDIGFARDDIVCKGDQTVEEMKELMEEYGQKRDYEGKDCFMCIILSHGDKDKVYGEDGPVSIDNLLKPFKFNSHVSLVGKPKIFLIQACRGDDYGTGIFCSPSTENTLHRDGDPEYEHTDAPEKKVLHIPAEADFFLAFAIVPGFASYRNQNEGSWFINAFVRNIKEFRGNKEMDLVRLMMYIKYDVFIKHSTENRNTKVIFNKMPCVVSTLTKEFYLW